MEAPSNARGPRQQKFSGPKPSLLSRLGRPLAPDAQARQSAAESVRDLSGLVGDPWRGVIPTEIVVEVHMPDVESAGQDPVQLVCAYVNGSQIQRVAVHVDAVAELVTKRGGVLDGWALSIVDNWEDVEDRIAASLTEQARSLASNCSSYVEFYDRLDCLGAVEHHRHGAESQQRLHRWFVD